MGNIKVIFLSVLKNIKLTNLLTRQDIFLIVGLLLNDHMN